MEPSGATEFDDPVLDSPDVVHLFGLGQLQSVDGNAAGVGGACTFATCVEAVLLALDIPFVVHAIDWRQKPAWFVGKFKQTYTPAMWFRGQFMQETKDIIKAISEAYAEAAAAKHMAAAPETLGEMTFRGMIATKIVMPETSVTEPEPRMCTWTL